MTCQNDLMTAMTGNGALILNKEKLGDDRAITADDLIDGKYLLAQKGKKNYYLITVK